MILVKQRTPTQQAVRVTNKRASEEYRVIGNTEFEYEYET